MPVVFDERVGEYHFAYFEPGSNTPATLIIYHCPYCGGAAPESKRHLLFHVVSSEEKHRLADLIAPINSVEELIEKLGKPDKDEPATMWERSEESGHRPSTVVPCRTVTYASLSEIADVHVYERPDGTLGWSLSGKYRGGASA